MLEVEQFTDVGRALDIVNDKKLTLAMSLGRHTNDMMTSFYVRTPSGFEIGYGTGGLLVDEENWEVETYDAMSFWGHRPSDRDKTIEQRLGHPTPGYVELHSYQPLAPCGGNESRLHGPLTPCHSPIHSTSAVKLESKLISYAYQDWLLVVIDLTAQKYCITNDSVMLALSTGKLAIGVSS